MANIVRGIIDMAKLTRILTIMIPIWGLIYVSRVFDYALPYTNFNINNNQYLAIFLGHLLPLTFLLYPVRKGGKTGQWYDWVLILMSVVPNAYVIFFQDQWMLHGGTNIAPIEVILTISVVIALLEGLRRVLGLALTIILLFFIIHPLLSNYMPGFLYGRGYSLERVAGQIFLPPVGIYSMPLSIAATILVVFLLFGQLFVVTGGGNVLMNMTLFLVGRFKGGAAKSAVIASGLFGTFSGAVGANVATTGTFTIPMMKKAGFKPEYAAGVEASASNGGGLLPPVMGAVAFIMAEMLQIPYAQVCVIAFIPAILYYFMMFAQVHFTSCRNRIKGLPSSEIPSFKETIIRGWYHLIPIAVLIYFLFGLSFTPETAAFWSIISILIVSSFSKKSRLNLTKALNALEASGEAVVQIGLATAMAGIVMASVAMTGIALILAGEIVNIAGGNMFFLLLLAGMTSFFLGMGLSAIPCYIFVVLMVAPALVQSGIAAPAAHLFVLWIALGSFITPPVCIAAYVASAIAGASPMKSGIQATMVGIGIYVIPFSFIYNPGLLLMGTPMETLTAVIAMIIGIIALAAGMAGFILKDANWLQRVLLIIAGLMMFIPEWYLRFIAAGIIALIIVWQKLLIRNSPIRFPLEN